MGGGLVSATFEIVILCGGVSAEREVSLRSGAALEQALVEQFPVKKVILDTRTLPEWLEPSKHIVFPALHGEFGEDGALQSLLEAKGIFYAGSDSLSSALCMQKHATKACARKVSVSVLNDCVLDIPSACDVDSIIAKLGDSLVVKPESSGSSVGLHILQGREAIEFCIGELDTGRWLVEPRFIGRELTVGVLHGQPQGVVEILSASGVYDYAHKYQPGQTTYRFPADLNAAETQVIQDAAVAVFNACGCRDFARADFLFNALDDYVFLEVNTLPGLTETSLLPKSAHCMGVSFVQLCKKLLEPAIERWKDKNF